VLNCIFSLGVTAEVLRANIDRKSAFEKWVGQFQTNFHVEGEVLHQPYLHAGGIHTKNSVVYFLQVKCTFRRKTAILPF